uniref:Uncharacterized protein n=1 Tax=Amphimedon queenslandica TaxID=400682 RepID=A0A1X7VRS0_AMPQE
MTDLKLSEVTQWTNTLLCMTYVISHKVFIFPQETNLEFFTFFSDCYHSRLILI